MVGLLRKVPSVSQPPRRAGKPAPKAPARPLSTPDLCDAHEAALLSGRLRVLPPVFQNYGGAEAMSGPIVTLKCFEDNTLVRAMLETAGQGRILVVDGGGSDRCALVGGGLGLLAEKNGWAGVLVNGCVRDLSELIEAQVGVWAIANHPRKSLKAGTGVTGIPVDIAGVLVHPGEWCVADADGVLISADRL